MQASFAAIAFTLIVLSRQMSVDAAFKGASLCRSDNHTLGYSDFQTLRNDIKAQECGNEVNCTYILCPYTLFAVDVPMSISSQHSHLICGHTGESSLECILEGGSTQLAIENSPIGVVVQGITFRSASFSAVVIFPSNTTSSIIFRDCRWENNTGLTALWIMNPLGTTASERLERNWHGSRTTSLVQTVIESSIFEGNHLQHSVVLQEVEVATLTIQDTTFRGNTAKEKIISINAGKFSVNDSSFTANTFDGVLQSDDIVLPQGERVTLQANASKCVNATCMIKADACYSDWPSLSRAVRTHSHGGVYIVCPGSLLSLYGADSRDATMIIQESSKTIKCGKDGSRIDNCIILGGQDQVLLQGNVTAIRFEGITFVQSSRVSIGALGTYEAEATFVDCEWLGNIGHAAVLVYNADSVPEVVNYTFASLTAPRAQSMTLNFTDCSFTGNRLALGSIANFYGNIVLVRTIFLGNEGEAGALSIHNNGSLAMRGSCFIGNNGRLGVVFVNSGVLLQNENSFGEGNRNSDLGCTNGVNVVSGTVPCIAVDSCIGDCNVFNATTCEKLTFPFTSTSSEPSEQISSTQPSVLLPLSSPHPISSRLPSLTQTSKFPSISPSRQPAATQSLHPTAKPFKLPPNHPTSKPTARLSWSGPPSFAAGARTVPCSLDSRIIGYDDSQSFLFDLALNNLSATYILCPGISINGEGTVSSSVATLIIQCANSTAGCFWNTTSRHLVFEGSSDSSVTASVRGVIFRQASMSSIHAQLSSGGEVKLLFSECIWEDNSGEATVLIINQDAQSEMIGGRSLQSSTATTFEKCNFSGNWANTSIISSAVGDLKIEECIFQSNNAQESIVSSTFGAAVVIASKFNGNTFSGARGLVFVGKNAILSLDSAESCQNDNIEIANISGNGCNGTFLETVVSCSFNDTRQVCGGTCLEMSTCNDSGSSAPSSRVPSTKPSPLSKYLPSLSPSFTDVPLTDTPSYDTTLTSHPVTVEPSYMILECYSDWKHLGRAIADARANGEGVAIKICANSLLDAFYEEMFAPIDVKGGNIKIQCGDEGRLEDNCSLYGGKNHFKISNPTKEVTFIGLTFIGARKVSMFGAANASVHAIFDSCRWTQNNGIGAILVYNEESGEPYLNQRNIEKLQPPSEQSMSISFVNCVFDENTPSFAVITTVAATIAVTGSVFSQNRWSRIGPISATNKTDLSVTSSCFMENEVLIAGVLFLDATSRLSINDGNYAQGNIVRLQSCTNAFQELSGVCIVDGFCNGDCHAFSGSSCESLGLLQGAAKVVTPAPWLLDNIQPYPPIPTPSPVPSPSVSLPSLRPIPPAPIKAPISPSPSLTPTISPLNAIPASLSPSLQYNAPLRLPTDSEHPTEGDKRPLAVLGDVHDANLYTSGVFIRTVFVAILVVWCCWGTFCCMRTRALKKLDEEIENDKKLEHIKQRRTKERGNKETSAGQNEATEKPEKKGWDWFKFGNGKKKLEVDDEGENDGLLCGMNTQLNEHDKGKNGVESDLAMDLMKIKTGRFA